MASVSRSRPVLSSVDISKRTGHGGEQVRIGMQVSLTHSRFALWHISARHEAGNFRIHANCCELAKL